MIQTTKTHWKKKIWLDYDKYKEIDLVIKKPGTKAGPKAGSLPGSGWLDSRFATAVWGHQFSVLEVRASAL